MHQHVEDEHLLLPVRASDMFWVKQNNTTQESEQPSSETPRSGLRRSDSIECYLLKLEFISIRFSTWSSMQIIQWTIWRHIGDMIKYVDTESSLLITAV
jgi:hypothetical protein